MVVSFSIRDSETGTKLNGILRLQVYNNIFNLPFRNGELSILIDGSFKGLTRSFTVVVNGYVIHEDSFIQNDGRSFDIELARFRGVPPPAAVLEPVAPPSQLPTVLTGVGLGLVPSLLAAV